MRGADLNDSAPRASGPGLGQYRYPVELNALLEGSSDRIGYETNAVTAHWISGGGKVGPVPLDKDVFGDGTVMMLATPGHTPGHHSLLVKLRPAGNFVITGDAAHFRENYDIYGVPPLNTSRAETLASLDRVKKIAANLQATVIIQHDGRDVGKLPAFPEAAR